MKLCTDPRHKTPCHADNCPVCEYECNPENLVTIPDNSLQALACKLIEQLDDIRDKKGDETGIAFCGRVEAQLWNEFIAKAYDL